MSVTTKAGQAQLQTSTVLKIGDTFTLVTEDAVVSLQVLTIRARALVPESAPSDVLDRAQGQAQTPTQATQGAVCIEAATQHRMTRNGR
jgi:hypothetical protein